MSGTVCPSDTAEICGVDERRPMVRASATLGGIDYVEVLPDGVTLCVHFFGALPKQLTLQNVVIDGGARIRNIKVVSARFHEHDDGDLCWLVRVDRTGDFSTYCLCLVDPTYDASNEHCSFETPAPARRNIPNGIDPRYACASFSFRIDYPSTLDCKPEPCPPTPRPPLPPIDYLARDYEGFRRLMLDRLAQTMPQWKERHIPDLGITMVELFAYVADQLSYQLDSVATEAFLRTARKRISVRRHARLVDYWMHEGSNARTWVTIGSDTDLILPIRDLAFAAVSSNNGGRSGGVVEWHEQQDMAEAVIFEPVNLGTGEKIEIFATHSEIQFYTWQRTECCLPAGSTRATLDDGSGSTEKDGAPRLHLKANDILIFEEIRGPVTGSAADADPTRRHAVRLTSAIAGVDPLTNARIWEIEWSREDVLPFDLRLSVRTPAPECKLVPAAVARGNVVLVDHGATVNEKDTWAVDVASGDLCCLCDGANSEQHIVPKRLSIELPRRPVTYAEAVTVDAPSAAALMKRDVRAALPMVWVDEAPAADNGTPTMAPQWADTFAWRAVRDGLAWGPTDQCFVVEIDDEGSAHLRFGDDVHGKQPQAGWRFRARLRVGNGPVGNVGRDAIVWVAYKGGALSGVQLRPRNPLAASGGTAPESIEHVKLYAPYAYGRVLERAVAADDYAQLAGNDPRVQGAFAELVWTGSWYEASVALDTRAGFTVGDVLPHVWGDLERARRIGHDLRIVAARSVPLEIELEICVEPGHLRGDVEKAARDILSNHGLPDGTRGMFHVDELQFGGDIFGSRIVAEVQAIDGVAHVELTRFARMYGSEADAKRSLDDAIIAIAPDEIAQLEADPNFPERGRLKLRLKGGR